MSKTDFDLLSIDKDVTLEKFIKILSENSLSFHSYRSDWNGEVRINVEIPNLDGKPARNVYFVFQNKKNNPKLQDLEAEIKDELGIWTHVHYRKFSRPWYKGGSIL